MSFSLLGILLLLCNLIRSEVIVTEIMYHPRLYQDYFEYIEVFNNGTKSENLAGWTLNAVDFVFPNINIEPNAYILVSSNPDQLRRAYPWLTASQVFKFPETAGLDDNGETVSLRTGAGVLKSKVDYKPSWNILTSGLGSSLELMCLTADDYDKARYWTASVNPVTIDPHVEYAGTPGRPAQWQACLSEDYKQPNVGFSEVHYHPYKTNAVEEVHEFVEIMNTETVEVDISAWRIVADSDGPRFTFPLKTILKPKEIIVVAKDLTAFNAVYGTIPSRLFGPYKSELTNGLSDLVLADANGLVVDYLEYDSEGSFPYAPDALAGNEDTLPWDSPFFNPGTRTINSRYVFKGQSLNRRSWDWDTNVGYNWRSQTPSPGVDNLEGPAKALMPIISSKKQTPSKEKIIANNPVTITVNLRPWPKKGNLSSIPVISSAKLTWWTVDIPSKQTKFTENVVQLKFDGDDGLNATIPGQAAHTIVRYKIEIIFRDFTSTPLISPRLKDPIRWHQIYFDSTERKEETFSIYMAQTDMTILWNVVNVPIEVRRVLPNGCGVNPAWTTEVNCTLIYEGEGYDAKCRLQGSRWNRVNGDTVDIAKWGGKGASNGQWRAFSYRVSLPAHKKIAGNTILIFHKGLQGCTFYMTPLLFRLADATGVPASSVDFANIRLNGKFLRYMMVIQQGGLNWVKRSNRVLEKRCIHQAREPDVGHVFNVHGSYDWEGPFFRGDFFIPPQNPKCPAITTTEVYESTYPRLTYKYLDYQPLDTFIRGLSAAENSANGKDWFKANVDINQYISYYVLDAWAGSMDHRFHNQKTMTRISDGKWMWMPWDADYMFGEAYSWDGTKPDPWNVELHKMKTVFVKLFRSEITAHYKLLQQTVLHPDRITPLVNQIIKQVNLTAMALSDSYCKFPQNYPGCQTGLKQFLKGRWDFINNQMGRYSGTQAQADADLAKVACPVKPNAAMVYNVFTSIPGPPPRPKATFASPVLSLTWESPNPNGNPIISYNIQTNQSGTWTTISSGSARHFETSNAKLGETLYFRITATNSQGESAPSRIRSFAVPKPCVWSDWSQWTPCSVTCQNGTQSQQRTFTAAANGGAPCIGSSNQTKVCDTGIKCPIDCTWNPWGPWVNCTNTCGNGSDTRTRTKNEAQFNGLDCAGKDKEDRPCIRNPCPVDCTWLDWTEWGACNVACGDGMKNRSRTFLPAQFGGHPCSGNLGDGQPCSMPPCPLDCKWDAWTEWGVCTVSCGGGITTRTRTNTSAQFGGNPCVGDSKQSSTCSPNPCPVDCIWEPWTAWTTCSKSCGTGTQNRTRITEGPFFGGAACAGAPSEVQDCTLVPCPVNCELDEWTAWSTCEPACGDGNQSRTKPIRVPPEFGGDACGDNEESRACFERICPKDCVWLPWSDWSDCSVTCGSGTVSRTRRDTPPQAGGLSCTGPDSEIKTCTMIACPPTNQPIAPPQNTPTTPPGSFLPVPAPTSQTTPQSNGNSPDSPSPSDPNAPAPEPDGGAESPPAKLPIGAIVGIIIGGVVAVAVIIGAVLYAVFASTPTIETV